MDADKYIQFSVLSRIISIPLNVVLRFHSTESCMTKNYRKYYAMHHYY